MTEIQNNRQRKRKKDVVTEKQQTDKRKTGRKTDGQTKKQTDRQRKKEE